MGHIQKFQTKRGNEEIEMKILFINPPGYGTNEYPTIGRLIAITPEIAIKRLIRKINTLRRRTKFNEI